MIHTQGKLTRLRDKRLEDASLDYAWQTDPELSHLDAAEPLTISFRTFLGEYIFVLENSLSLRVQFGIETLRGEYIGYCACYNLDIAAGEAEVGIMIGQKEYWGKGYGNDALGLMIDYVFEKTSLKRLHLKTLQSNIRAQQSFRKCGFKPCGEKESGLHRFMLMGLSKADWLKHKSLQAEDCPANKL
ncbi:acetyltransferase [Dehalococcoides mccartyi]|uniref:Acetyltransferase, GNAT family n=2 Tax=Dehalococcoides mccartyi TaxID=61435 RepID=A0A328EQ69_9CHLR|nr:MULTISPECIES: GNAT family N-acetyltransferase [Dehalococcoides]AGG06160.1 acetyltransferase, GNAT family [Dehalococcoides mccartyi DCMB5]AGG07592.1 acetyltransferase, GNAT family [Dehalococcoides mccartyi BTF08]KSV16794.1 acetyltransferase [Dehalococcoides mccartyi]RAL69508.1 acetyltransferase, GNAT family [Dehalococcoides mccartyi]RAL70820.1 acetyltransferase, GNAT family [Dehalococcoides mccartyi]